MNVKIDWYQQKINYDYLKNIVSPQYKSPPSYTVQVKINISVWTTRTKYKRVKNADCFLVNITSNE